jgi:hypothetical protein
LHYHYSIQEDSTGTLYSCDTGVSRSLDHGKTWEDFSEGLGIDIPAIIALGIGPLQTIFAAGDNPVASRDYVIYRRAASQAGVQRDFDGAETDELLEIWPNPAHDKSSIRFYLTAACTVRATVYDLLGIERKVSGFGRLQSGEHVCSLGLEGLTNGSYLISLQAGDKAAARPLIISR